MIRLLFAAAMLVAAGAAAEEFSVTTDREDAIYQLGETVTYRIGVKSQGKPLTEGKYAYRISRDQSQTLATGEVDLARGNPAVVTWKPDQPGFFHLNLTGDLKVDRNNAPGGFVPTCAGAAVAIDRLRPSVPYPDDFMQFWEDGRKAVADAAITLTDLPEFSNEKVAAYRYTVQSVYGAAYGFLAMPKAPGRYPALARFPGSGPGICAPEVNSAARGIIVIGLNAIDYEPPTDAAKGKEIYRKLHHRRIYNSIYMANEREAFYFRRVILLADRMVSYIAARPEWDGKHFVFTGSSQGGQLCFAIAGLNPHITAIAASVPDYCDSFADRSGGNPYGDARRGRRLVGDDSAIKVLPYFDSANFARTIKCSVLASCGFCDTSCPASGIIAACNILKVPEKRLVYMPNYTHSMPKLFTDVMTPWVDEHLGLTAGK